jgi:hypothetical protein
MSLNMHCLRSNQFRLLAKEEEFFRKEKQEKKKGIEFTIAFQQIQVQQYGIKDSHCILCFRLFSFLYMQYLISTPY